MKSPHQLHSIAKVSQQRERNAARHMGKAMGQVQQQQKQLDDLVAYRQQYIDDFNSTAKTGLPVVQLRDYQVFIQRLDIIITQQQEKILASHKDCSQSKANWKDKHNRSKMIDKVIEKRQDIETQKQNVREQREQDDRVRKD